MKKPVGGSAGFEQRLTDAFYSAQTECERSSKQYTLARVPEGRRLKVLDVGCGTGLNAVGIAAKGHYVIGIDISAVALPKFRATGLSGVRCDIQAGLPFPASTFDLVYASEVIEHLKDTEIALAEIHRVLKRGGSLILSTPNSAFWVFRVYTLVGRTLSEVQHPGHVRFFSKRSLIRALSDAEFVSIDVAARHMFFVVGPRLARLIGPLLRAIGFQCEFRFATKTFVWHLSRYARRASALWADCLIVTAVK